VEAIVCSGVGRRALATLETAGIRVLVTHARRVDEVLESFRAGALREISAEEACAGHRDADGCHGRS
jgi:predicted Fe-Mo cluster-binding NifX family protein